MTAFALSYLIAVGAILLVLLATKKVGKAGKDMLHEIAGILNGFTEIIVAACALIKAIRELINLCKRKGR
ncbi:hypothetical protein [Lacticaseibacillus sharpeae]|uniref:Uncharacterized protein n=1 Tax=Lacticaseibacillus sharpeae JCM 1186 = DSM 20505 TaxID=1291052 RepID=A0A0R1ZU56_9LACO|nr:hypothetical protein [Lacticaseibacillus sharpeae]KRM55273.1 hypothetical protein FC18_GL001434 [Lacticaseibacillus sharpeae JCM 1186 = DSM 20505]